MIAMPPVTLCITTGNRPALLKRTLESLLPFNRFDAVLAVNDFGDEETNEVFHDLCPDGLLVRSPAKRLQHVAIDAMYSRVTTPLIMHCEDDWLFAPGDVLSPAFKALESDSRISAVAFPEIRGSEESFVHDSRGYWVPGAHAERTFAYTLQPALLWRSTWETFGPFAQFTSEGKIKRAFYKDGRFAAYIDPGLCSHIGYDSVAHVSGWNRVRRNVLTRYYKYFEPDVGLR
jgi:glycosyltransferase involved in cell wall biosynthesis